MSYQTEDYQQNPPHVGITRTTMDILLMQDKPDQLIALYMFYCYTSTWQKTSHVKATNKYVAKGLGWSVAKVTKVKKILLELDLIRDSLGRNEQGIITGWYVLVRYAPNMFSQGKFQRITENPLNTSSSKKPVLVKTTPKYLVTNNKKCLVTNSRALVKPDTKTTITNFDRIASKKLHQTILTKKKINLNTSSWPNTFRLLRIQDKVPEVRIKKALMWYNENIGGDYVPVAECARTFREKFIRIEAAMQREQKNHIDQPEKICTYRMGPNGEMGYYDDSMEL